MHELLLFGSVPSSRHDQVLNILAGIAAMQPQAVLEKNLIFKPNRNTATMQEKQVGGAQDVQKKAQAIQAQEFFHMQLVADAEVTTGKVVAGEAKEDTLVEKDDVVMGGNAETSSSMPEAEGNHNAAANGTHAAIQPRIGATEPPLTKSPQWTLQFRDLPEPARQRPVTSRLIADTPITSGDPIAFMKALDYTHISTYYLGGHRYTHNSISLLLYRIHIPTIPSPPKLLEATTTQLDASPPDPPPIDLSNPTSTTIDPSKTRLLDPFGSYILQAAIRVQDGSKLETMSKAVQELLGLKEMMKGCVELEMGDRLAADTRAR